MKIGVRGKLFILSIALIASFGLASGVFLETKLRSSVQEQLQLPPAQVDAVVGELRTLLLLAGLVGLLVAGFMSVVASELFSRTLRELAQYARAVASGEDGETFGKWPDDEVGRLAGSVKRISDELLQTVGTLTAERDRLQAILLAMHDAVLVVDESERITLANSAAHKLFALPDGETTPVLSEVVTDAPELSALITRALSGQTQATIVTLGDRQQLQTEVVPLASMGALVLMHDVTELRRLETMRRDFVGNVSHELRTPVSVIRVNAETLLDGALDDELYARRFVERILRSAERLSHLVTDLLDLSRIEAGRYATKMDRITVLSAVDVVMEDLKVRAAERNIAVEVDIERGLLAQGDATALEQILQNLLDNAISYTPAGGHVQVRARERDELVSIEVEDDGPGISPQHHARIFERFYRVDPGRSRQMGGTGLGLAIVKHLSESMGGRVGVRAAKEDGTGALFWVELACAPLSGSPAAPGVSSHSAVQPHSSSPP